MNVVVDRIVQYPNRFQLVNTSTGVVLGVFDLSPVTGTIQQVGTEINAELFESIQEDLTALAQSISNETIARGEDVVALQNSIATKITANGGELGNAVVTFADVSNATNIASGEKASTLFGKIKNWISRLKALAFKDTIADGDISSSANISQSKVSGLTAIQSKLDGIESGANKYVLPVSTATNLGGVKVGSRLSVASDGTLSANSQTENSYTTTEKNKLAGIEENANNYSLPVATATQLGGVKKGSGVTIASDGTISADAQTENSYTTAEKTKLAGIESGAQVNDVTSVNGKVGAVTLDKSNVGLGNVDNVQQYSASNPPPFEVITGVPTIPTKTSQLTNDSGFLKTIPQASNTTRGGIKLYSSTPKDSLVYGGVYLNNGYLMCQHGRYGVYKTARIFGDGSTREYSYARLLSLLGCTDKDFNNSLLDISIVESSIPTDYANPIIITFGNTANTTEYQTTDLYNLTTSKATAGANSSPLKFLWNPTTKSVRSAFPVRFYGTEISSTSGNYLYILQSDRNDSATPVRVTTTKAIVGTNNFVLRLASYSQFGYLPTTIQVYAVLYKRM